MKSHFLLDPPYCWGLPSVHCQSLHFLVGLRIGIPFQQKRAEKMLEQGAPRALGAAYVFVTLPLGVVCHGTPCRTSRHAL